MTSNIGSRVWNFIKTPFGVVASLASIIGIPLTLIIFNISTVNKELAFYPNEQSRSVWVDRASDEIGLIIKDGDKEIAGNIASIDFLIWNNGNTIINFSEDIRENAAGKKEILVKLVSDPEARIIKSGCSYETNPAYSGFKLNQVSGNMLSVEFNSIKPKEGVVCQVVFEYQKFVNLGISSELENGRIKLETATADDSYIYFYFLNFLPTIICLTLLIRFKYNWMFNLFVIVFIVNSSINISLLPSHDNVMPANLRQSYEVESD